jgi:RNA polymerase sigma factor (sigma-70 family)
MDGASSSLLLARGPRFKLLARGTLSLRTRSGGGQAATACRRGSRDKWTTGLRTAACIFFRTHFGANVPPSHDGLTDPGADTDVAGTVHIVDDDASFVTAMERRLKVAGYDVVTYPSALQLLDRIPDESEPGCILLDVQIPDVSGPDLQDRLSELGSTLPIVFLTGHADIPTTVRAIKAGAENFLTKPVSSEQLLHVIGQAMAHHEASRCQRRSLDAFRELLASLTPRERQVFDRVVQGKINKQIAHQLGATERTIKAHRHRVMEKMKVQTLAELVSIAERFGMVAHALDGRSAG